MEERMTVETNEMKEVMFENLNLAELDEMEEVITPGWGTLGCCTE